MNSIQVGAFFSVRELGMANDLIRVTKRDGNRVTYFDFGSLQERTIDVEDFDDKEPFDTEYTLLSEEQARVALNLEEHHAQRMVDKLTTDIADFKNRVQIYKDALGNIPS